MLANIVIINPTRTYLVSWVVIFLEVVLIVMAQIKNGLYHD